MIRNHKQAASYILKIKGKCGLTDWTFWILEDPPSSEGASADVEAVYGRKLAKMRFSKGFFSYVPEEQRYVVVHEILHCHHAHADNIAVEAMNNSVAENWTQAMEYAIDGVANALAKFLPLP